MSGPIIRGSGIPWDLRKTNPYEIYNILTFMVPTGLNGDSYSRYYVRLVEMRESLKIIEQCVNFLNILNDNKNIFSDSPFLTSINTFNYQVNSKHKVKMSMEELV